MKISRHIITTMSLALVKGDPHRRAKNFTTRPWSIKIEGEVEKSLELSIEEILAIKSEERILKT